MSRLKVHNCTVNDGPTKDLHGKIQTFFDLIKSLSPDDAMFKENFGNIIVKWSARTCRSKVEMQLTPPTEDQHVMREQGLSCGIWSLDCLWDTSLEPPMMSWTRRFHCFTAVIAVDEHCGVFTQFTTGGDLIEQCVR